MSITAILLTIAIVAAALVVVEVVGLVLDRWHNPPELCSSCAAGRHTNHTAAGCSKVRCVCRIRDNDPTEATT